MRIYLDARNITARPGGVARYAQCLIPELARQAPGFRFVVLRHASNREPLPGGAHPAVREVFVPHDIGTIPDFVAGARWLGRAFAEHGAPDVYHALFHVAPRGVRGLGPKVVVTLHDLIWVDHPHASQASWLGAEVIRAFGRVAIGATLRAADRVISVSQPTADAAERRFGALPQTVIPHGVDPRFFEAHGEPEGEIGRLRAAGEPYAIAVGNAKPYKNLGLLVEAFARHAARGGRGRLVLVGPCEGLAGAIAAKGLGARVVRAGFLEEVALCRAISRARLFVFPSLVEGFGLPPLEAMALGVPTAVADVEPMRSVVGEGAMRFDPRDPEALAGLLAEALGEEAALSSGSERGSERWSERGRARAAELTWERAARETLAVYRALGAG